MASLREREDRRQDERPLSAEDMLMIERQGETIRELERRLAAKEG